MKKQSHCQLRNLGSQYRLCLKTRQVLNTTFFFFFPKYNCNKFVFSFQTQMLAISLNKKALLISSPTAVGCQQNFSVLQARKETTGFLKQVIKADVEHPPLKQTVHKMCCMSIQTQTSYSHYTQLPTCPSELNHSLETEVGGLSTNRCLKLHFRQPPPVSRSNPSLCSTVHRGVTLLE